MDPNSRYNPRGGCQSYFAGEIRKSLRTFYLDEVVAASGAGRLGRPIIASFQVSRLPKRR